MIMFLLISALCCNNNNNNKCLRVCVCVCVCDIDESPCTFHVQKFVGVAVIDIPSQSKNENSSPSLSDRIDLPGQIDNKEREEYSIFDVCKRSLRFVHSFIHSTITLSSWIFIYLLYSQGYRSYLV